MKKLIEFLRKIGVLKIGKWDYYTWEYDNNFPNKKKEEQR